MNTNTTALIKQATNNRIKFTHAEDGELDTCQGNTVFSDLFIMGAFASTSKYVSDDKGFRRQYQTDEAGLKFLESKSSEAITIISDTVAALGEMLVHADKKAISDSAMTSYGWLIVGLGEIIGQLSRENSEVSYVLSQIDKQK